MTKATAAPTFQSIWSNIWPWLSTSPLLSWCRKPCHHLSTQPYQSSSFGQTTQWPIPGPTKWPVSAAPILKAVPLPIYSHTCLCSPWLGSKCSTSKELPMLLPTTSHVYALTMTILTLLTIPLYRNIHGSANAINSTQVVNCSCSSTPLCRSGPCHCQWLAFH